MNTVNITADKMVAAKLCTAETAAKVAPALDAACKRFDIATPAHVRSFLAQCATESVDFTTTEEGLDYGPIGLSKFFSKYFPTPGLVTKYAHKPEAIANRVYGNRMGNGPESTGDGFKFRGRGFIQITGHDNYAALSEDLGLAEMIDPDLVATPEYAALSAAWYWWKNNINKLADTAGIEDETKAVNGGLNGLADRQYHYDKQGDVWETP